MSDRRQFVLNDAKSDQMIARVRPVLRVLFPGFLELEKTSHRQRKGDLLFAFGYVEIKCRLRLGQDDLAWERWKADGVAPGWAQTSEADYLLQVYANKPHMYLFGLYRLREFLSLRHPRILINRKNGVEYWPIPFLKKRGMIDATITNARPGSIAWDQFTVDWHRPYGADF